MEECSAFDPWQLECPLGSHMVMLLPGKIEVLPSEVVCHSKPPSLAVVSCSHLLVVLPKENKFLSYILNLGLQVSFGQGEVVTDTEQSGDVALHTLPEQVFILKPGQYSAFCHHWNATVWSKESVESVTTTVIVKFSLNLQSENVHLALIPVSGSFPK